MILMLLACLTRVDDDVQNLRYELVPMNKDLLQTTTPEIVQQVHDLLCAAQHAALAVSEVGTNHPAISRVAIATIADGTPILLTSVLAPHTAALHAEGRCSLLIGEVGKGDPMAHPRATLFCQAELAPRAHYDDLRTRFLSHHPKAKNYIDLPDFGFWQLQVFRISYNAGFGKAFAISGEEFISKD